MGLCIGPTCSLIFLEAGTTCLHPFQLACSRTLSKQACYNVFLLIYVIYFHLFFSLFLLSCSSVFPVAFLILGVSGPPLKESGWVCCFVTSSLPFFFLLRRVRYRCTQILVGNAQKSEVAFLVIMNYPSLFLCRFRGENVRPIAKYFPWPFCSGVTLYR